MIRVHVDAEDRGEQVAGVLAGLEDVALAVAVAGPDIEIAIGAELHRTAAMTDRGKRKDDGFRGGVDLVRVVGIGFKAGDLGVHGRGEPIADVEKDKTVTLEIGMELEAVNLAVEGSSVAGVRRGGKFEHDLDFAGVPFVFERNDAAVIGGDEEAIGSGSARDDRRHFEFKMRKSSNRHVGRGRIGAADDTGTRPGDALIDAVGLGRALRWQGKNSQPGQCYSSGRPQPSGDSRTWHR